jgi:hypothetical protein
MEGFGGGIRVIISVHPEKIEKEQGPISEGTVNEFVCGAARHRNTAAGDTDSLHGHGKGSSHKNGYRIILQQKKTTSKSGIPVGKNIVGTMQRLKK